MRRRDLAKLISGTSDAAYVVDDTGVIVAWNEAAEELFGVTSAEAIGRHCRGVVQGFDECGLVCSDQCLVQQSVARRIPVESFDIRVRTTIGSVWCNVSVMIAECTELSRACAIHLVRPNDVGKRLEMLVRDFVISKTDLSAGQATALVATNRGQSEAYLSPREKEVLGLLAAGGSTKSISESLFLSRTTVNNHIQHILHKLDAHTRLEAIRRAERAGVI